jgi:hypothetical protein
MTHLPTSTARSSAPNSSSARRLLASTSKSRFQDFAIVPMPPFDHCLAQVDKNGIIRLCIFPPLYKIDPKLVERNLLRAPELIPHQCSSVVGGKYKGYWGIFVKITENQRATCWIWIDAKGWMKIYNLKLQNLVVGKRN